MWTFTGVVNMATEDHVFDASTFDFFAFDVDRPEQPIRSTPGALQILRSPPSLDDSDGYIPALAL